MKLTNTNRRTGLVLESEPCRRRSVGFQPAHDVRTPEAVGQPVVIATPLGAGLKTRPVRAPGLQATGFSAKSCRPRALTRRFPGVFKHALSAPLPTTRPSAPSPPADGLSGRDVRAPTARFRLQPPPPTGIWNTIFRTVRAAEH